MAIPIMIVLTISGLSVPTAIPKPILIGERIEVRVEFKGVREHVKTIIDKPLKHCGDAGVL
jgi:hypothetical protein